MYLLSSVEFLRFACRNDAMWFLYIEVVFCSSDVRFSSAVVLTCDGGLVDN